MPTITYRAFGVPGCLDPLNYKKAENGLSGKFTP
jgi:hypothetical protein